MTTEHIDLYLKPGKRVHLVGAGGVSMSALAEVLFGKGLLVTGSDRNRSEATDRLCRLGIPVTIGEDPSVLEKCDAVIRTAAAKEDNPEIQAARQLGKPLLERAAAWGAIMREYRHAVCFAGTHGKTTTTGMFTHIAIAAGLNPTVMMGGSLPLLGAGHRVGSDDMIILESCEYCNSFHHFFPTIPIVLNIESDHLDFFDSLDDIIQSFRLFAELSPPGAKRIGNGDDCNVRTALKGQENIIWFGKSGEITAANSSAERGCFSFDILAKGQFYAHAALRVPGEHNLSNALGAAAAAYALNLPGEAVGRGLSGFTGAGRRMEYKGQINGADIYDDYAHHPTEIAATLKAARAMGYQRLLCVFQPHTYTRTKGFFKEFCEALADCDVLYLAKIYAARESDNGGISSDMLADAIPGARSFSNFDALAVALRETAREGDIILTAGAGDIYKVAERL